MQAGVALLWTLGTLTLLPPVVLPADTKTSSTTVTPATTRSPRGPLHGSVTCATVEQAGSASALHTESLRAMQPQQASSCIAFLGKDPLAEDQARAIWDLLLQAYDTADMIPDDTIRLLGWVSAGIPPDHMANLSLTEIDTVTALGAFHNLSLEQVLTELDGTLATLPDMSESVRFQWSAKEPEDLSHLDLAALNHILCGFNASELVHVHADAYKEAASSLSLLRCPGTPGAVPVPGLGLADALDDHGGDGGEAHVAGSTLPAMRALATLAEGGDAFGDAGGWTAHTVRAVGCVLVGLPIKSLVRVPTASLHTMLQALAGNEQPVIRNCLYGTPIIGQRLSSSDLQQNAFSVTTPSSRSAYENVTSWNKTFANTKAAAGPTGAGGAPKAPRDTATGSTTSGTAVSGPVNGMFGTTWGNGSNGTQTHRRRNPAGNTAARFITSDSMVFAFSLIIWNGI